MATTDDELSLLGAIRKAFQFHAQAADGPSQILCIVSPLALYDKAFKGELPRFDPPPTILRRGPQSMRLFPTRGRNECRHTPGSCFP